MSKKYVKKSVQIINQKSVKKSVKKSVQKICQKIYPKKGFKNQTTIFKRVNFFKVRFVVCKKIEPSPIYLLEAPNIGVFINFKVYIHEFIN